MATVKRRPTLAAGGVVARDLVRRRLVRQRAKHAETPDNPSSAWCIYTTEIDWLDAQPARTKRPGGIGR